MLGAEVASMGGHGSGRRRGARPTTDAALALDVRILARGGGLTPGAHAHTWPSVWGDAAVGYTVGGDLLVLAYRTRASWLGEWREARQAVRIERTPCRYGGDRPWFACPLCRGRVAVLFCFAGSFRCRACHGLAYASTREDRAKRVLRKANRLRAKLGGEPAFGVTPPRPAWLGERAYGTTVQRIRDLDEAYATAAVAKFGGIEALREQLRGEDG